VLEHRERFVRMAQSLGDETGTEQEVGVAGFERDRVLVPGDEIYLRRACLRFEG
jgi:hypothetical protein